jgi:hypothetical protein
MRFEGCMQSPSWGVSQVVENTANSPEKNIFRTCEPTQPGMPIAREQSGGIVYQRGVKGAVGF